MATAPRKKPGPQATLREPAKLSTIVEAEALRLLEEARWRLRKTKGRIVSEAILEYCQRHNVKS